MDVRPAPTDRASTTKAGSGCRRGLFGSGAGVGFHRAVADVETMKCALGRFEGEVSIREAGNRASDRGLRHAQATTHSGRRGVWPHLRRDDSRDRQRASIRILRPKRGATC